MRSGHRVHRIQTLQRSRVMWRRLGVGVLVSLMFGCSATPKSGFDPEGQLVGLLERHRIERRLRHRRRQAFGRRMLGRGAPRLCRLARERPLQLHAEHDDVPEGRPARVPDERPRHSELDGDRSPGHRVGELQRRLALQGEHRRRELLGHHLRAEPARLPEIRDGLRDERRRLDRRDALHLRPRALREQRQGPRQDRSPDDEDHHAR